MTSIKKEPAEIETLLQLMEDLLREYEKLFETADFLEIKPNVKVFRFKEQSPEHFLLLKVARMVSILSGMNELYKVHHFSEIALLHRAFDETVDDILFMSLGLTKDELTVNHIRLLDSFWTEEKIKKGEQGTKRATVPRDRIRSYLSSAEGVSHNPSDFIEHSKIIYQNYSGFIHGAAFACMENYSFDQGKYGFDVRGIPNDTGRIESYFQLLWDASYRGFVSFAIVAKAFGIKDYSKAISELLNLMEQ